MEHGIVLFVFVILGFLSTLVTSQDDTKWAHVCTVNGGKKNISCAEGSTFEINRAFIAYRTHGCPENLTDPVQDIADCSERTNGLDINTESTNERCNGSRVCALNFGGESLIGCNIPGDTLYNFYAVNYKCIRGPEPETTSQPDPSSTDQSTTSSTTTLPTTTVVTVVAATSFPYIIPLAAGGGGAIVLLLLIALIVCCVCRNKGDERLRSSPRRKESVSEVNIVKRDERVKTAPRIKEENWNRPDITITSFDEDRPSEPGNNSMDPRGLYALPDKSNKNVALRMGPVLPPESIKTETHYEIESPESEQGNEFPRKESYENVEPDNGSSEFLTPKNYENVEPNTHSFDYVNEAYTPDDVEKQSNSEEDWPSESPEVVHRVRFAGDDDDDDDLDSRSPDDLSDYVKPLPDTDAMDNRGQVTSGMYAEVNKSDYVNSPPPTEAVGGTDQVPSGMYAQVNK